MLEEVRIADLAKVIPAKSLFLQALHQEMWVPWLSMQQLGSPCADCACLSSPVACGIEEAEAGQGQPVRGQRTCLHQACHGHGGCRICTPDKLNLPPSRICALPFLQGAFAHLRAG